MLIASEEIIAKSFKLYKDNFRTLLSYSLLLVVPTLVMVVPTIILRAKAGALITGVSIWEGKLGLLIVLVIAAAVLGTWFATALVKTIANVNEGKGARPVGEELNNTFKLIWPVILASLVSGLIVFAGALLLIVPGIIFAIWYAFVMYAVVIDGKKPLESLSASKALVTGRWWGVFWRLLAPGLVLGIVTAIAASAIQGIFWVILKFLPFNFLVTLSLSAIVNSLANAVFIPLVTLAPVILYTELKKTPLAAPQSAVAPKK